MGDGFGTAATVMDERGRLTNLAYRLLGSLADAEDAVQETYLRWYRLSPVEREAIRVPGAWLTTVAGRICLDALGSAKARRERYVGEWLPEPLPDRAEWVGSVRAAADPADRVTLDESVDMAFLVVLESMTPAERVAFILHDVFRYPFPEVAAIVGRTPDACRQLATSARRRVREVHRPAEPTAAIVKDFKQAWENGDIDALIGLLDPNVRAVADGGGQVNAHLYPVEGGGLVAQGLITILAHMDGLRFLERTVNGRPGLTASRGAVTDTVIAFDTADGRISRLWVVRNPQKLRAWNPETDIR